MESKTRRIHKFPELSPDYSGPRLIVTDVVDPSNPNKFKTRCMAPETVLHFELLSPTQSVQANSTLLIPMLPLNFTLRNFYVTFTESTSYVLLDEALVNLFIGFGLVESYARELMLYVYNSFTQGYPDEGGWGGYRKPKPTKGQSTSYVYGLLAEWFGLVGFGIPGNLIQWAEAVDNAMNLAKFDISFGKADEYDDHALIQNQFVEPGNMSIELDILNPNIPHSAKLGLKINSMSLVPANNGVVFKGLTVWLIGAFEYPIDLSRKNIGQ